MTGWVGDIEQQTLANETFRSVLFTGDALAVHGDVPASR